MCMIHLAVGKGPPARVVRSDVVVHAPGTLHLCDKCCSYHIVVICFLLPGLKITLVHGLYRAALKEPSQVV